MRVKNKIQLSDHFDYKRLLRYSFPTMIMMVFTSIYGVVDGLFVSNVVGKNAFAAINMIIPALMVMGGFGTMFGTGGTALVAKTLGEKNEVLANRYFSMMIEVTIVIGSIFSLLGFIFMPNIASILGVSEIIRDDAITYGRVCVLFMVPMELQYVFQSFMTAAEKPKLGLKITVIAGLTNMVLDALFIGSLHFGVAGAALATGLSQCMGGVLPLVYFCKRNDSLLQFALTPIKFPAVWQAAFNGMSELMTNVASSIVSMVYNIQLMKYAGENGVAAYGVLMYVMFIFIAILFGYTMGTAPIISYHFGAGNKDELKNLLSRSMKLEYVGGILMFIISQTLARPISMIFVGYDQQLLELTVGAFRIFLFVFILAGGNIFASAFFTALNNGPISATISFLRSIVFELMAVLLLPLIFGLKGIWCAVAIAECAACIVSWTLLLINNKKYNYM